MPQWISADALHVVVRNEGPAIFDTKGRMIEPKKRRVFAKFERSVAPFWVRELDVVKTLPMDTKPENMIRENWLCYYSLEDDSVRHSWSADERKAIEDALSNTADIVRVERPRLAPPWPAYDKLAVHGRRTVAIVAEKIAEQTREGGYDPEYVAAYERENANREEVLAALAAISNVEETEDEPLIAA